MKRCKGCKTYRQVDSCMSCAGKIEEKCKRLEFTSRKKIEKANAAITKFKVDIKAILATSGMAQISERLEKYLSKKEV